MVARRLMLAVVLAAVSLLAVTASPARVEAHPLHTTMTDLSYDPATRALNVIIRVFADDFSAAVMPGVPRRAEIVVPADSAILRYVTMRFGVTGPGSRVPMRWCGRRREGKVLFLCLHGTVPGTLAGASLRNGLLTEMFADQVNVVQISYDGRRRTLLFTPRDGAKALP
jgi:hypothetical protein